MLQESADETETDRTVTKRDGKAEWEAAVL